MHQCFSACVFQAFGRVLVSQLEQGQASTVCLFFYFVGSKQLVYHLFRGRTDTGSPVAEPLFIPFTIEFVVGRHMIRVRAVLTLPAVQPPMAADAGALEINLHQALRAPDVHFLSHVFIRNGIELIVDGNVIVDVYLCRLQYLVLIRHRRKRAHKRQLLFGKDGIS